jgi:hypothetical protein
VPPANRHAIDCRREYPDSPRTSCTSSDRPRRRDVASTRTLPGRAARVWIDIAVAPPADRIAVHGPAWSSRRFALV